MRAAVAVINPSLFEGWSTTVEEAKSIGVPQLLSDLPVHREQSPLLCKYFDPHNSEDVADVISLAWHEWQAGPHLKCEEMAIDISANRRRKFAQGFLEISKKTIKNHV